MSLYNSLLERLSGSQYNGYFACCCPFHDDHKPSMFVYEDGAYCKTCNRSWSLKQVERKIGSHFRPSRDYTVSNILPNWKRWEFEYGDLRGIAEHAHQLINKYPQFRGYLKKRRCDGFIETGYLGYLDGWITIPVYDENHVLVDMVVRGVKKGETRYVVKTNKDGTRPLYSPNWERVKDSSYVYIPFGIFDAWAFEAIGEPCVTGITGQSMDIDKIRDIGKRGIFVPDLGEAETAHKFANQLGWKYKVKELSWPDGTKDPDEVRRFYGEKALESLLNSAA